MPGLLEGKVALITGSARGMGEAEARLFVAEGARVVIADVLDEQGEALANSLGENAIYRHLDVADESNWQSVIADIEETFGGLDILVNNAAILRFSAFADTSLEDYMQVLSINQVGTFLGTRSVIEPMKKRGGGAIVNISSVDGMKGSAGLVSYASSKWAVRGMTKVAAAELGPHGIRVNSVHPGGIQTAMTPSPEESPQVAEFVSRLPLPRIGQSVDVARTVLFLASEQSAYTTGCEFPVDGGYVNCRALPGA
ncbi:SDR family NAD(P)-dependent oxidoreductase [Marinobacterium aestuariivivens]|uniref:SDR family NAD(P)-dependent oxidoreductase n=1 Tax=Marinobacterium aestuariivivens TaxID=1698799 RepID=A0ABW2A3I0_9GAMM